MHLFIDDTFATSTYTHPISTGELTPPDGLEVTLTPRLDPEMIEGQNAALIASPV